MPACGYSDAVVKPSASDARMQVFAMGAPFDYGVTLSDAVDMPVNLGMQFVPRGRYNNAIAFLHDVIAIYPFNETFIAGQVCTLH